MPTATVEHSRMLLFLCSIGININSTHTLDILCFYHCWGFFPDRLRTGCKVTNVFYWRHRSLSLWTQTGNFVAVAVVDVVVVAVVVWAQAQDFLSQPTPLLSTLLQLTSAWPHPPFLPSCFSFFVLSFLQMIPDFTGLSISLQSYPAIQNSASWLAADRWFILYNSRCDSAAAPSVLVAIATAPSQGLGNKKVCNVTPMEGVSSVREFFCASLKGSRTLNRLTCFPVEPF